MSQYNWNNQNDSNNYIGTINSTTNNNKLAN